jgi:hypothetical protein
MCGTVPLPETDFAAPEARGLRLDMVKLYRSAIHPHDWVAYREDTGWVMFPAQSGGWKHRRPATGLQVARLFQVPVWLSFNTGLLEETERRRSAAA